MEFKGYSLSGCKSFNWRSNSKRPKFGEGNKVVVLTASNNDTETTYSHDFTFVVKQKEEAEADKNERVISGIGLAQLGYQYYICSEQLPCFSFVWRKFTFLGMDGQPVQGNTVSISEKMEQVN